MLKTTISKVVNSTLRRLRGSPIEIRSQMVFLIRFAQGKPPGFSLGPVGSQLACYVPDGIAWHQINYGQAEGQVEINGREWGFYWYSPSEMGVVLHSGEMNPDQAAAFARAVAMRVAGSNEGFELLLSSNCFVPRKRA